MPSWVEITPSSGSGDTEVSVKVLENNETTMRNGSLLFSTANTSEEIQVLQLDRISSYFNRIYPDGSVVSLTASEYNHALATWAMELSYAAYNYPTENELPVIPGAFMGDFTKTAEDALSENEFSNIVNYNYNSNDSGAHTIGWRNIDFPEEVFNPLINTKGETIDVYRNDSADCQNSDSGNLDDMLYIDGMCDISVARSAGEYNESLLITSSKGETIDVYRNDSGINQINNCGNLDAMLYTSDVNCGSNSNSNGTVAGSTDVLEIESYDSTATPSKELVVVDIRGSVTLLDWGNNIITQIVSSNNRFASLADDVFENVESYLTANELQNPIILVTGHSLGAAVANILATRLNEAYGADNVYAYTFATPRTVDESLGNYALYYPNIFNILNSNDVVTYVPMTALPIVNYWQRHGIDYYINMPYTTNTETAPIGVFCHMMSTYLSWMKSYDNVSAREMYEFSSAAKVRGLLPIFVKVKCPVGVTIKDESGNIIAYESQQENMVYPDIIESGITSWIDEDGAKMFFIPSFADATSIEITAYDSGFMDFSISSAMADTDDKIQRFESVNLYPGKEFAVEISEDVPVEDTRLFVTENGEIIGEVTDVDLYLKDITAEETEVTYGTPIYFTITTDETVSEIRLHNRSTGNTLTLVEHGIYVIDVTADLHNLIWEVGFYPNVPDIGYNVYDISVKSGDEWYDYYGVITINVFGEV